MLELLLATAEAVTMAMHQHREWGLSGAKHGQYHHDVAADAAALGVLEPAGVAILSEESGVREGKLPVTVVIDPIDGSKLWTTQHWGGDAGRCVWTTRIVEYQIDGGGAAVKGKPKRAGKK